MTKIKNKLEIVPRASGDQRDEWTKEEQFDFEEEIFGTVLSGHRLDPYKQREDNFILNAQRHNFLYHRLSEDLSSYNADEEIYLYCQGLTMSRKSPYSKDPKKFTRYFDIEDRYGKGRITMFDQSFNHLYKTKPMNPFTILAKKLPYRPVMIIKCKVNEYQGNKSLVFDSLIEWINEEDIKQEYKLAKAKELPIQEKEEQKVNG
jgi:DNA polymerase III alpha subunit